MLPPARAHLATDVDDVDDVDDNADIDTESDTDTDFDVVIAGAGPTGLMLAAELRLAGVRTLVLERRPALRQVAKANGIGGHILDLLDFRGLLDRLEPRADLPRRSGLRFPFGTLQVNFAHVPDSPLRGITLPQAELERILDEHVRELGADVRRGHEVVGADQTDEKVTVQVDRSLVESSPVESSPAGGPQVDGPQSTHYPVTARFLVGCDGPRSRVREIFGIPFPGTTYAEVNRLAHVTLDDTVTEHGNGDLEIPGLGRIHPGFTRTERGVFAFGRRSAGDVMIQTTEAEPADVDDDDSPLTLDELQDSIRHILGAPLPVTGVTRLSRYGFQARQVEQYRHDRVLLAGEAAHAFPATGVGLNAGMTDAVNLAWKLAAEIRGWASPGLLDTYHSERHYAGTRTMMQTQAQVALRRGEDPAAEALRQLLRELFTDEQAARRVGALISGSDLRYPMPGSSRHPMAGTCMPNLNLRTEGGGGTTTVAHLMHRARPVLLDLADRKDLREIAAPWQGRVDIHTAETDDRPADAVLIRPDAHVAWAADVDEPADTAAAALREALITWFGSDLRFT